MARFEMNCQPDAAASNRQNFPEKALLFSNNFLLKRRFNEAQ
jgi:hypothetical protein